MRYSIYGTFIILLLTLPVQAAEEECFGTFRNYTAKLMVESAVEKAKNMNPAVTFDSTRVIGGEACVTWPDTSQFTLGEVLNRGPNSATKEERAAAAARLGPLEDARRAEARANKILAIKELSGDTLSLDEKDSLREGLLRAYIRQGDR